MVAVSSSIVTDARRSRKLGAMGASVEGTNTSACTRSKCCKQASVKAKCARASPGVQAVTCRRCSITGRSGLAFPALASGVRANLK